MRDECRLLSAGTDGRGDAASRGESQGIPASRGRRRVRKGRTRIFHFIGFRRVLTVTNSVQDIPRVTTAPAPTIAFTADRHAGRFRAFEADARSALDRDRTTANLARLRRAVWRSSPRIFVVRKRASRRGR